MTLQPPESPAEKLRRLAAGQPNPAADTTPHAAQGAPATQAASPATLPSAAAPATQPPTDPNLTIKLDPTLDDTGPMRRQAPSAEPAKAPAPPADKGSRPAGVSELTGGWFQPETVARPTRAATPKPPPPIDNHTNMPHPPGRIPQEDPYGTRVQPSALRFNQPGASRTPRGAQASATEAAVPSRPTYGRPADAPGGRRRTVGGCLWSLIKFGAIASVAAVVLGIGVLVIGYVSVAATLPSVDDLQARASQFETTRVYDGAGNLIYEIVDPQEGRRTRVPLERISPYLVAATIATEDKDFYSHPGFDPFAILRAIYTDLRSGGTGLSGGGASTITQQLVRALVLSPEEAAQRSNSRKIREIILAAEITRRYSKDEILELYLNEIYYGNLAYGIEAAAETYFGATAAELTLGQASFLAGLPQAPAVYDVYTDPETTLGRQRQVLGLMLANGCTGVSNSPQPVCIDISAVGDAMEAMATYNFQPPVTDARFPHWVNYIRQQLEATYGTQLYRSGYSVYTTLDPALQQAAEAAVAQQIAALTDRHVTNGALVAMRPTTGEIVAMVGSDDYNDPVDGQINMALRPRQPGSSIKPLTYALAFEKGWTPATLLWDVPTEFPDGANPPYKPVNYDGFFHGPVRVRTALANSYNIPAVKALAFTGIYGDGAFLPFAHSLGIAAFNREDYGLALTLGGGEASLLEMTNAYAALANSGQRTFPVSILRITDAVGNVICQQPLRPAEMQPNTPACQPAPDNWNQPVISAETAYLISDILADNNARSPAFGANSALQLSFPAAVKTGTTNDYRDNWTIGYTADLVVGVWVGNADYTPMVNTSGVTGAAPIWHQFMEGALAGRATPFARPAGIVERTICAVSGAEPSEFCPGDQQRSEVFAANHLPLSKERDLWQRAYLDPFTSLRQTADCARYYQNDALFQQERIVFGVDDPWAQKWLIEDPNGQAWAAAHGMNPPLAWAPTASCGADSPHPMMSFAFPPEGGSLNAAPIEILGQAGATADFDHYILDFGLSADPQGWASVKGPDSVPVNETGKLGDWDLSGLPDGPVTLRVIVYGRSGGTAEARVHFTVVRPTGTATETPTVTVTPTETPTPTASPTATATPTPTEKIEPTATETEAVSPTPEVTIIVVPPAIGP
ncbi:MAG: transglycosylase domain-containing protein [Anaerolineales bacterium]|nr:transglycosylase domain-containing protein [Anaerolineales bacterium]